MHFNPVFQMASRSVQYLWFLAVVCIICSACAMVGLICCALLAVPLIFCALPCVGFIYLLFYLAINNLPWLIILLLLLYINTSNREYSHGHTMTKEQASSGWRATILDQTPLEERALAKAQVSPNGQAVAQGRMQDLWSQIELYGGLQRVKQEGGNEQSWRDYHAKLNAPDSLDPDHLEPRFQRWRSNSKMTAANSHAGVLSKK